jgi:hypothetical protein
MRKMMSREITTTTVKIAKMEVVNGLPQAVPMEDEVLLGNVNLEKAQKEIGKKYGQGVTVFEVSPDTQTYELAVDDFLKAASLKVDEPKEEIVQAVQ